MERPSLMLTRPKESAKAFLNRLDPQVIAGVKTCISPLLEIVFLPSSTRHPDAAGTIFSSVNGVAAAAPGSGQPCFCVGSETARAASARGWDVRHVAQDADALVSAIGAMDVAVPLVHLSGVHRRGEIAERLTQQGTPTTTHAIYDQVLVPLSQPAQELLQQEMTVIVPLFSPRTATQFVLCATSLASAHVLAISPAVGDIVAQAGAGRLDILKEPTAYAMTQGVERLLQGKSLA